MASMTRIFSLRSALAVLKMRYAAMSSPPYLNADAEKCQRLSCDMSPTQCLSALGTGNHSQLTSDRDLPPPRLQEPIPLTFPRREWKFGVRF